MTGSIAPTNVETTPLEPERLEAHEVWTTPVCPFPLPDAAEREFLLAPHLSPRPHKDITFDPATRRLGGTLAMPEAERARLAAILEGFSEDATRWLQSELPSLAEGLTRDRVTFRTQEVATRAFRLSARKDLLHIDQFPTRPTRGRRILRICVNIDPTDSHVWAISEPFAQLLARYSVRNRVPSRSLEQWQSPASSMIRLFRRSRKTPRSVYDEWMRKLHNFLKESQTFQSRAARRVYQFAPGAAWALFSDGLAHAQLRGRFALEHSFFVEPGCLNRPESSPIALLVAAGNNASRRAG